MKIYFHETFKCHITNIKDIEKCHYCHKVIRMAAFNYRGWNKHEHIEITHCQACTKIHQRKAPRMDYIERRLVIFMDSIPSQARLVLPSPPSLKEHKDSLTVFDVHKMKGDAEKENAVQYKGRSDNLLADQPRPALLEAHDRILDRQVDNISELDRIFQQNMKAMPLIDGTINYKKKKQED